MIPVDTMPISVIVEFVNEYADETRRIAGEADDPYPVLDALGPFAAGTSACIALANEMYGVFSDPVSAPDRLNHLIDEQRLAHRLASDGRLVWMRPEQVDRLAAATVAALTDFVVGNGSNRFGTCAAHACADVFVDTSPSATRSYCSPQCHSRARVARWRAAHRQATPADHRRETR